MLVLKRTSVRRAAVAALVLTMPLTAPLFSGLLMAPGVLPGFLGAAPAFAQDAPPAADAKTPDAAIPDTKAPAAKTTPDAAAAPEANTAAKADSKPILEIKALYVRQDREQPLPLSLLDLPAADNGIAGANLAIADNNTTGKFLNQSFKLDVIESNDVDDIIKQAKQQIASGANYIVADMAPDALLKFADALAAEPAIIANVGSPDDTLREENCRANVIHISPTRTMLADALGQYLSWKQWRNWFLVSGTRPEDKALADAFRRAAKRFGSKIVDEREFAYDSGSRRSDGGFEQVQQQIPQFMQNAKDHDIVVVADEGQLFADYMPYRTWIPRPVAGSAGLTASSWHPALELWGATQFQNRFRRLNNRMMSTLDYDSWLAVRVIGEAASRKQTSDYKVLSAFIHSPEFEVAAFKGVKTTLRAWNGQLRQPLIVSGAKLLVSISPQPGFLHQFTELDTLGIDRPETKCKAYAK